MGEDWTERAVRRILVPLRIEFDERAQKHGEHGAKINLAKEIGIHESLLGKLLGEKRARASMRTIQTLAAHFHVEPGYLFDDHVKDDEWERYKGARLEPELTPDDVEAALNAVKATPEERKAWHDIAKVHKHRRITGPAVQMFVLGLRRNGPKR